MDATYDTALHQVTQAERALEEYLGVRVCVWGGGGFALLALFVGSAHLSALATCRLTKTAPLWNPSVCLVVPQSVPAWCHVLLHGVVRALVN